MMRAKFPYLEQFLGAYFHQDWDLEDGNALEVICHYLRDESATIIPLVIDDIEHLLGLKWDEPSLRNVVIYELGCYYDPTCDGLSYGEWLRWVQMSLKLGFSVAA